MNLNYNFCLYYLYLLTTSCLKRLSLHIQYIRFTYICIYAFKLVTTIHLLAVQTVYERETHEASSIIGKLQIGHTASK